MILQMYKKKYHITVMFVLITSLVLMSFSNVFAVETSKGNTVNMANGVTARLHGLHVLTQGNQQVAAFTVEIINNSSSHIQLIDYWAKIKNKSGKYYSTKMTEKDKNKVQVLAKTSTYITYYANVEKNLKYSDLLIELVRWDFNRVNYEDILGSLQPAGNTEQLGFKLNNVLYENQAIISQFKGYTLYTDSENANINIQLELQNMDIQNIELSNLFFYIQTENKEVYLLNVGATTNNMLASKEKTLLSLQAKVPKSILNKKNTLIISRSENANKVNLPIGMYSLPNLKETSATNPNKTTTINLMNKAANISISDSYIASIADKDIISTNVTFENLGTSKIDLSNVFYYLKTKDGSLYPLNNENNENVTLLPRIKQTVSISGQVKNSKDLNSSEIIVMSRDEAGKYEAMLANFKVNVNVVTEKSGVVTKYNGYEIKQVSLQRMPLDLTDILIAEFSITNKTNLAKPIVPVKGYFLLDGVKISEEQTRIEVLDDLTTLAPNQTYNIIAFIEIPYNQETSKVEFVMLDSSDAEKNKTVFKFYQNEWTAPFKVSEKNPYSIMSIGKKSEINLHKSYIIKGIASDFFYAELLYTNKEKRSIAPTKLAGFIQNDDGSIINVSVSESKQRILPNGKVLLSAWVKVPKDFSSDELNFYFGEAINLKESEDMAIVKPAYAVITNTEFDVKNSLDKLSISNYLLTMKNLYASVNLPDGINPDGINLTFDYDLTEDLIAFNSIEEHKVLVEFVDHNDSKTSYSQEFSLNPSELQDEALKEGSNLRKTIVFKDPSIFFTSKLSTYTINVYSVFQGNKILLATKDYKWFTREM